MQAWRTPEPQRNGDLVVPLVNASGEVHGLRATRQAWRELAVALLAATEPAAAGRRNHTQAAARGEPLRRPSGAIIPV